MSLFIGLERVCKDTHTHTSVNLSNFRSARLENPNNVIRNKFDNCKVLIEGKVRVFCIAETKRITSLTAHFFQPGFHKPIHLHITGISGWLLVYVNPFIHNVEKQPNIF